MGGKGDSEWLYFSPPQSLIQAPKASKLCARKIDRERPASNKKGEKERVQYKK
jgi:hypothetical protein